MNHPSSIPGSIPCSSPQWTDGYLDPAVGKQFAPVGPIQVLEQLNELRALGTYHLVLAHDVAEQPERFRKLFCNTHTAHTIIIDNSVIELGFPITLREMSEAVRALHNGHNQLYAVYPDILMDAKSTVQEIVKCAKEWASLRNDFHGVRFCAIPQGSTKEEFFKCAEDILKQVPDAVDLWGIAKNFVDGGLSPTRWEAVKTVEMVSQIYGKRRIPMHLFGFTNNLFDDMIVARESIVKGIDSAVPLHMADKGLEISFGMKGHPARGDFWKTTKDVDIKMVRNIEFIRRALIKYD